MADRNLSSAARASAARAADQWWVAVPLLTLLLLAPILVHGRPFVFWDTAGYYEYGAKLVEFAFAKISPARDKAEAARATGTGIAAPPGDPATATTEGGGTGITFYGSRSPFFSVWLYSLACTLGLWAVVLLQAAAIAWIIWRAALHATGNRGLELAVVAAAIATLGAGAWFPIGFAMPDAFAGIALASVALLFAYADRMSRNERLAAALLLAVAAIVHVTHLATVASIAVVAVAVAFVARARAVAANGASAVAANAVVADTGKTWLPRTAIVVVAAALTGVVLLQAVFDFAARVALGTALKRPPFLMARIIADGPGRLYLDRYCAQGGAFAVCAYRDRHFGTSDEFLWSGVPTVGVFQTLPLNERLKLIDEETRFVAAVAFRYPLRVLGTVIGNTIAQLAKVAPEEAWIDPGETFKDPSFAQSGLVSAAPFLKSCVERPGSCVPKVPEGLVLALAVVTLLLSFGVIALHVVTACRRHPAYAAGNRALHQRAITFAAVIVVGLVVNAVLCGAFSGPHARYQVRVVWLAVLAAAILEASHPIVIARFRRWDWR